MFEETHRLALRAGARRPGGRAAGRPPRRPGRPGRLPRSGCAPAAPSACGWRRSSTRASGCATGRCRARSATSSSTTSRRCSSTPPARRRSPSCGRRSRATRARSRRLRWRRSSSRRAAPSRRSSSGWGASFAASRPPTSRRPWRRCPCTAPTWRRRPGSWPRPIARRSRRPGCRTSWRRILLLEEPAPPEFVTRFQQTTPAVMAKGVEDTAFYRYGRLLALNDVGGDPSRFAIGRGRLPRGERRARRALPARAGDHPDPRRQALGRRARPDRRAGLDAGAVGRARAALVRAERAAAWRRRARPRGGVPPLPDAGGRLADRVRARGGLHGEGAARGQAQHELGGPGRRTGRTA